MFKISFTYFYAFLKTLVLFEMKITIHQPEYLPWVGFFHKMLQADLYVVLDNVQFKKNNFQNRNRLIDRDGNVFWSSVPVCMKGHIEKNIADMRIDNSKPWQRKIWGRIESAYCRHPYFKYMEEKVSPLLHTKYSRLIDLNMAIMGMFRQEFGIKTKIIKASQLEVDGKRSDLLANIVKRVGGKTYLSGPSGQEYLESSTFVSRNIDLEFHDFTPISYPAKIYKPYLSALDLFMNVGPSARDYLGLRVDQYEVKKQISGETR